LLFDGFCNLTIARVQHLAVVCIYLTYFAEKIAKLKKQQKKILANTEKEKQKVFSLLLQWTSARHFDVRDQSAEAEKTGVGEANVSNPSHQATRVCSALSLAYILGKAACYPKKMKDKVNGKARYCQTVANFFLFFFEREEILCAEQQWLILGQSGSVGLGI